MKKANYTKIVGILTVLLAVSLASAAGMSCTELTWEKEFKEIDEGMEPLELVVLNDCASEVTYSVMTDPSYESHAEESEFTLPPGISKKVLVFIDTSKVTGGTHDYDLKVIAGESYEVTSAAFKVPEEEGPSIVMQPVKSYTLSSLPAEASFEVKNLGNERLDKVVLEVRGETRTISLQPGEKKVKDFRITGLEKGTHEVKATVSYGDFERTSYMTVEVIGESYPLSTEINVQSNARENEYTITYWLENQGDETLQDVQAKVSDAPAEWDVINPGKISLSPGESKTQEITIDYGESSPEAKITVSVTSNKGLVLQEGVDMTRAYKEPVTGLFGLSGTVERGLLFLFVVVFFYAAYKEREQIKRGMKRVKQRI